MQKYSHAAEVHMKVKLLGECVSQHFHVVKAHVAAQVDGKVTETGGFALVVSAARYLLCIFVFSRYLE